MPNDPTPFTDAQRELFDAVAKLNRTRFESFHEADQWIDTRPPTAEAEYARFRDAHLANAADRRRRKDRSYGIEISRPEKGHGVVTYHRRAWLAMPDQQRLQVLRDARNDYGRNLRYQRRRRAEGVREEAQHGPLQPHELIELAAHGFTRPSEPLVFDAMNPQQKALWARRLLRVVWILTDTADLTTTRLGWLREWKWGEHQLEFLNDWTGTKTLPIPRLWSRMTILDRELEEWERLAKVALRALEQAEPGATAIPATARTVPDLTAPPPVVVEQQQQQRRGRLPKEEREAKRASMLATIRQHSSLKDDPAKLAADIGVSESTIRRWLDDEQEAYRNSKAARAEPDDDARLDDEVNEEIAKRKRRD